MLSLLTGKKTVAAPAAGTAPAAAAAAPAKKSLFSSLTSSLGSAATAAKNAATSAATSAALDASFGTGASKVVAGSGGVSSVTSTFQNMVTSAKSFFSWYFRALFNFSDPTIGFMGHFGAWLPFILLSIGLFAYLAITRGWFDKKDDKGVSISTQANVENTGSVLNAVTAKSSSPISASTPLTTALTPSGNRTTQIASENYTLLNLQPRAIKQLAYIGPLNNGSFDVTNGISQTLRSGFRFLILQIDYLDTTMDATKFPPSGVPTLVYRGDDGRLLSSNSADINDVANMIASTAFRQEIPNYTEPLIIYLHILRAPSQVRSPDEYMNFLSTIATSLNPLAPTHLNTTSVGIFTRQKQEPVLINTPISAFNGQTIILCNADTTIFRSTTRKFAPADDLDYWVNMRVYLNSSDIADGITQVAPAGVTPSAVLLDFDGQMDLSKADMDTLAAKAKKTFVIAMCSQMGNPTTDTLGVALNDLGIHVIPIDIFSVKLNIAADLIDEYSGMTFRPKPPSLRNI